MVAAVKLSSKDRQGGMGLKAGTLFIKTMEEVSGTDVGGMGPMGRVVDHHLKPRKGELLRGQEGGGRCGFCRKGPFANMWVCLDKKERRKGGIGGESGDGVCEGHGGDDDEECGFVVCRMCCNEKVQEGEAELF